MKRILYIGAFTPLNTNAGVGYSNQFLADLARKCNIDMVYFGYKNEPKYKITNSNIRVLKRVEINTLFKVFGLLSLPWLFPIFTCRFSWKICRYLKAQIKDTEYDYIYFDFSQSFSYSIFIRHPQKIFMSHDVMAQKYSRMKRYFKPWARLSESYMLRQSNAIFTFSDKDCSLIKDLYGLNSTPTTFYLRPGILNFNPSQIKDYFVMFGAWSREENYESVEWFLNNVYPSLATTFRMKIIGSGMPSHLLQRLANIDNIEYLGFVDNPYPIISESIAEIAPLRKGAGVKVKCIEALACGCPIIGSEVAFEGIPAIFEKFIIRSEDPIQYIQAIKNISFTLSDHLMFKDFFVSEYNNKSIIKYILG